MLNKATKIFKINEKNPEEGLIEEAADIIKKGGLLAFPTETVYGLGGDARDPQVSKKIYSAKGRPSDNPLIVHISNMEMLEKIVDEVPKEALVLAKAFWPGPLTFILKKSDYIPKETTGGLDTVAVRMPSRLSARLIIDKCGIPVAAPSANISGRPSPTKAEHVIEDFDGRIDGIVDDGPSPIGLESTILDLTVNPPAILRKGYIEKQDIDRVLGVSVVEGGGETVEKPKAPGMKYRHYAPKAELTIIETKDSVGKISELLENVKNKNVAVVTTEENKDKYPCRTYIAGSRKNGREIMSAIYGILRDLDSDGIEVAFSEGFSDVDHGSAIMERLIKAAGHRIIRDDS